MVSYPYPSEEASAKLIDSLILRPRCTFTFMTREDCESLLSDCLAARFQLHSVSGACAGM